MARVKPKRHGVITDMTAMCDVAFLLLTFFILTTQFKKPDVVPIKPPTSISEKLLPESSLITVNVNKDGSFFFQPMEDTKQRGELLDLVGKKHDLSFSDADKAKFAKIETVPVPIKQLKSFLALSEEKRKEFTAQSTGIPMDSLNTQLLDWIAASKAVNKDNKLAIKGDIDTKFPKVKYLFEGLRDINYLNFWLITSQEVGAPQ